MIHRLNISSLVTVVAATALSLACSDEVEYQGVGSSTDYIAFHASNTGWMSRTDSRSAFDAEPLALAAGSDSVYLFSSTSDYRPRQAAPQSRGTVVTADNLYGEISISAYHYTSPWASAGLSKSRPNYFADEVASAKGSGRFDLLTPRYWPSSGNARFLVYAPVSEDGYTFVKDDARGPVMSVTLPTDAAAHKDMLMAYTEEIACKGSREPVELNFIHPLTCIQFVRGSDMKNSRVESITISGVSNAADFLYGMGEASSKTGQGVLFDETCIERASTTGSFTLKFDNASDTLVTADAITDDTNSFFMIPQTCPDGAMLEIKLRLYDSASGSYGEPVSLTASLAGRQWPAGKRVIYTISHADQILEVSESGKPFDYAGRIFNVDWNAVNRGSYTDTMKLVVNSALRGAWMPPTVTYTDDDGTTATTSDWLSYTILPAYDANGNEIATQRVYAFTAKPQYVDVDIDANLAAAPVQSGTYYLASPDGSSATITNTANSYMIDHAGTYSLPLVYGNAITGGADNTGAYKFAAADSCLSNLVNHLNQPITTPYLKDAAVKPSTSGAVIIWEDVDGLITDLAYDATSYGAVGGLKFTIPSGVIQQGNAIIGIKDTAGNIMWSWHIWVTRFDFDKSYTLTNDAGTSFTVMPVDLGWCSSVNASTGKHDTVRYFRPRSCQVTFSIVTHDGNTLAETRSFAKTSHTAFPRGNTPYYQWGRKDPFVGADAGFTNKYRYHVTYCTDPDHAAAHWLGGNPCIIPMVNGEYLTTNQALGEMIKHPDWWHRPPGEKISGSSDWISHNVIYHNLWGSVKTVYDPSPVGYHVSDKDAFTAFTNGGYNVNIPANQTDLYKFANYVWPEYVYSGNPTDQVSEFYTDNERTQSVVFPRTGYRDWGDLGQVERFGEQGSLWSNSAAFQNRSYYFQYIYNAAVSPAVYELLPRVPYYSSDAFPVRPEKE